MRPPPFFWVFNSPSTRPPGAAGPHSGKGHVGRHCPYTHKIWCGSVHTLLRYRSKTTKMQKFPIDSHSNENFIAPFFRPEGRLTPKRGEDTSGTRVRPHANFGVNRPAGCREIVDRTEKKQKTKQKTYSKNISRALRSNERMASNKEIRRPILVINRLTQNMISGLKFLGHHVHSCITKNT